MIYIDESKIIGCDNRYFGGIVPTLCCQCPSPCWLRGRHWKKWDVKERKEGN